MTTETIHVSAVLPAKPKAVYTAWIDAAKHAAMTGAPATSDARVGGRFTAWEGYIEGTHAELTSPRRVVQTWRSSQFPKDAAASRLIVLFDRDGEGTRVTVVHTDIPAGQGSQYESGWKTHYFKPMTRYFKALGKGATKKGVAKKSAAKAKKSAANKR
jgi:activator of HSP90 ATPase